MSRDFFEDFNKRFRKIFDDWAFFDEDFNDFFRDVDERFEINYKLPLPKKKREKKGEEKVKSKEKEKDEKKSKAYSISYRWHSGMKEPTIRAEGDVDEDTLNNFLMGIQRRFGQQFAHLADKKVQMLSDKQLEDEENILIPIVDRIESSDSIKFVYEMPGIGKDDINITFEDDYLILNAKRGDRAYHSREKITEKIDRIPEIIANNGILTLKFTRKSK